MKMILRSHLALLASVLMLCGCTTPAPPVSVSAGIDSRRLPSPNLTLTVPGFGPCTATPDETIHLDSNQPVNIIVHGCRGSAARFRSLAQVFAFHGQQTICFSYDDRDSLMKSSAKFIDALEFLSANLENRQITIIGHSQGGLITRKALVKEREDKILTGDNHLQLVTISAPFAGIAAADHCASSTARWLTLGLVIPICKIISGDKWYELTHRSAFIQQPGELLDQVANHLKIVTDETGSCRDFDPKGKCIEDDFVFSLDEQYFEPVDAASCVENIEVSAGHAEIVGDHQVAPQKLIGLLQQKGIMNHTPPARQNALAALLSRLYR